MIESIKKRKSIRTYDVKPLHAEDEKKIVTLIKEINAIKGPFGHYIKLFFHPRPYVDNDAPVKIGTYGFIKNAPAFISGTVEHTFLGLIDFGYLFEYLILRLTELQLGTVWLAGTFQRKNFKQYIEPHHLMPAITPVGYENETQTFMDKMIRKRSKGDHRLPFDKIFFDKDFQTPIKSHDPNLDVLELIRIAPSASNKQPWRIIVDDDDLFHLFLERTPNYAKILNFDIQALDMGIALCHLTLALKQPIDAPNIYKESMKTHTNHQYIATIKKTK